MNIILSKEDFEEQILIATKAATMGVLLLSRPELKGDLLLEEIVERNCRKYAKEFTELMIKERCVDKK